jgi:hypothetical protein
VVYYRVYFLDHKDRITDAVELDCDTDEEAIAAAEGHATGRKIEVWQQGRKVGVFGGLASR